MSIILHHEGKFLVYSNVCDAPISDPLDEQGLIDWHIAEAVERVRRDIQPRIERAIATGTSGRGDRSLEDTIFINRAGAGDTRLSPEQFIAYYFGDEDGDPPVGADPHEAHDDED